MRAHGGSIALLWTMACQKITEDMHSPGVKLSLVAINYSDPPWTAALWASSVARLQITLALVQTSSSSSFTSLENIRGINSKLGELGKNQYKNSSDIARALVRIVKKGCLVLLYMFIKARCQKVSIQTSLWEYSSKKRQKMQQHHKYFISKTWTVDWAKDGVERAGAAVLHCAQ